MKQLFRISDDAYETARINAFDVSQDLVKVGLFKSPFDEFAIEIPIKEYGGTFIIGYNKNVDYWKVDPIFDCGIEYIATTKNGKINVKKDFKKFVERWVEESGTEGAIEQTMLFYSQLLVLIILLATKNIAKEVKHNPLAKFGVGKIKAEYVTTLSIGKITETEREHADTGRELRTHIRRGHIRNQRYGPNNSFSKQIWIEPVFINSDKEYVPPGRVAYNLSLLKGFKSPEHPT